MSILFTLIRASWGSLILAPALAFGGVLADSTVDFSATQGAKNWYYGYFPGGDVQKFAPLPTYDASAARWEHASFGPPWTLVAANSLAHPNGANSGTEEWAVREWVSNYTGPIILTGHLAKVPWAAVPSSTGVYGRIYYNHQLVYEQFVSGTDATGVDYSVPLTLKTGDTLDFAVAPNGSDSSDATLFSAKISSEYDAVSVDFGAPATVKSALGFLNGFQWSPGQNPPTSLILPLQPRFWRAGPADYQRIRSFAPTIPVELVLMIGWPQNNYDGLGPPWQNWAAYQSRLAAMLTPFAPAPTNAIFEVWNEPDEGWAFSPTDAGYHGFWSGTAQQFAETYLHAFQTIRSTLGPRAQVAGPSFAIYDHQSIQDFLEYCLANGCEVNALTWHELNDASSPAVLAAHVQDARTSFLANPRYAPLKIQRIDVNEIVGAAFTHSPAGTLAYYSALEASGADGATRSCWSDSAGNNECFNGTLGGLLTSDTFQPRAVWWLQKSYAEGVSARVQAVSANPDVIVLASGAITGADTPQVLVANSNFQSTVKKISSPVAINLSLANLQAVPTVGNAASVGVRVERIPNTGEAAVSQPNLVEERSAAIIAGTAQITLPPLQVGEVYRITLVTATPATTGTPQPAISAGGIISAGASTPALTSVAPGGIFTIFGNALASAERALTSADLINGRIPTNLGGTCVEVGGARAPLFYVSSTQINAQVPVSATRGADQVRVLTGCDGLRATESNTGQVTVRDASPEFFYFGHTSDGTGAIAAVNAVTGISLGPTGLIPGASLQAARPGDIVTIYGTGFGSLTTALDTGEPAAGPTPIAAQAVVTIGNVTVQASDLLYVGATPGFAGLYQVNLRVPAGISPGLQPVVIRINGSASPASAALQTAGI